MDSSQDTDARIRSGSRRPRHPSTHGAFSGALVGDLLARLLRRLERRNSPWLVGLSGLQGSGKSTLAHQIVALARRSDVSAIALSLDDFYLTHRERQSLARTKHPLLATRGVPGTHDVALIERTLAALARATPRRPARVPRFDKGRDSRVAPSRWRRVAQAPQLIVLEGWCLGVPPQPDRALLRPANALEVRDDADGQWRRGINARLAGDYAALWKKLDLLVLLQAPAWREVLRWRDQQEQALRARKAPRALNATALRRFLEHFERLSRHGLRTLPALAALRLPLDRDRRVRAIVG